AFFTLTPQIESEKFKSHLEKLGASSELVLKLRSRITALNYEIEKDAHLGSGFTVGHSYFCPNGNTNLDEQWYLSVINDDIAPLVREYWFDQRDKATQLVEELKR